MRHRARIAAFNVERLEARQFLSSDLGPTSAQLGQSIIYSTSDGGLWKSNLDGSNPQLIKHFDLQPHELIAFHGAVYFAGYGGISSGEELWKTGGDASSTMLVKDLYPYAASSQPHDFMIVNDHLYLLATNPEAQLQLFTTDGADARQLYIPPSGSYTFSVRNVRVMDQTLYYEEYVSKDGQWESFTTDPSHTASRGVLRIYGSDADNQIDVRPNAADPAMIDVNIDGDAKSYDGSQITSIVIDAGAGNDNVRIDPGITIVDKIYGDAGDDTIRGGGGNDRIYGGDGNDWISGGAGNDILYGNAGDDRLFGGDGADHLFGGAGSNMLRGEAGRDRIVAVTGDDIRGNDGDRVTS